MKLKLLLLLAVLLTSYQAHAAVLVLSPNGAYVTKPDLATFATSADCANKTAVVTTPQTVTSEVTIPADRSVEFRRGGMVTTTGAGSVTFAGAIVVQGGDYQVFSPSAKIVLSGSNWGNPRWWGAQGDGRTDDGTSGALQSALNAGKTRWTTGQYLTGVELTARFDIIFDDWQNTVILAKPETTLNPVLMVTANSPNSVAIETFKNIHIAAASRQAQHQSGVVFKQGTGGGVSIAILDIQNILVSGMNGYGVKFDSVWDSTISNIHTEDCGSTVFSEAAAWFGSTTGDSFNQCTVSGIQFERSVYQAMNVDATSYSNRFFGIHIEATTNLGTDIILGGYRNQYYGAGHLGANHRYIYVGGESNSYDGLFLEAEVRDANLNPGNIYRMSSCTMPAYNGNGGAGYAQFSNCTIGTFTADGQEAKIINSDITSLVYSFMSVGLHITGGSIGSVTGNGTLGYLDLAGPVRFKNSVTLKNSTHITQAIFDSDLILDYTIGSTIESTTVGGTLTLQGNTSDYKTTVTNSHLANLWVDVNQESVISGSTITGTATESGAGTASRLNQTTVMGTITGFTLGALPAGATAVTAAAKDSSAKVATTKYTDDAVSASTCSGGYKWVDPSYSSYYSRCPYWDTGTSSYKQMATASSYIAAGTNPIRTIFGSGIFTNVPYCTLTPGGTNSAVQASIVGIVYDAGTGQVTVTANSTDSGTGFYLICHGR